MSDQAQALSKVLGRGSAHEGAHHWRVQRLTAVALLLLGAWFLVSLALLPDYSHGAVHAWASGLVNATLLALFAATACWHSQLGVQVVIEDYVHGKSTQSGTLAVNTIVHVVLAIAGIVAVLALALKD